MDKGKWASNKLKCRQTPPFSGIRSPHQPKDPLWYYFMTSVFGDKRFSKGAFGANTLLFWRGAHATKRQNRGFILFGQWCENKMVKLKSLENLRKDSHFAKKRVAFKNKVMEKLITRTINFSELRLKLFSLNGTLRKINLVKEYSIGITPNKCLYDCLHQDKNLNDPTPLCRFSNKF